MNFRTARIYSESGADAMDELAVILPGNGGDC